MSSHPEKEIQRAIERLRSEIDILDPGSHEAESLTEVVAELERALAEMDEEDASVAERIGQVVEKFEIEHPRITGIMNDLMVTLSGLGI